MKQLYLLSLLFVLFSCTSKHTDGEAGVEVIAVENAAKNDLSFLECIEVIPLETNDSVLMKDYTYIQYLKEEGMYLVKEQQDFVFLFDEKGRFIGSSQKQKGEGPQGYYTGLAVDYNEHTKTTDIYGLTGGIGQTIQSYDTDFNLLSTKRLLAEEEFYGHYVFAFSKELYAIYASPFTSGKTRPQIRLCDFSDKDTTLIENIYMNEEYYIAETSMQHQLFMPDEEALYFAPPYLDNHIYTFDLEQRKFTPIYRIEAGDMITRKQISSRFSKRDREESDYVWKESEYVLSTHYMLPIIRLINDGYVYVHCISQRKQHHLIHNRRTKLTFFLTPDADMPMHRCYELKDNELVTILHPFELEKYITDESWKYLSPASLERLETLKEDDNPVILKYCLKR